MSKRAVPTPLAAPPATPAVDKVTAQLSRHLQAERLDPALLRELGELCAGWGNVSESMRRKTVGERIAEIRQLRGAAVQLQALIDGLDNADHFGVFSAMSNSRVPREQRFNQVEQLIKAIDVHLSMLSERPLKSRRPPAHNASVFMPSLAHCLGLYGIPVSLSARCINIVDACIAAANLRRPDGQLLDAIPLVKEQIQFEKVRASAQAALALQKASVKS